MTKPSLNESTIRRHATEQSFYRGEAYYHSGAIVSLVQRDNVLLAEIEGSQYAPYHVRVTFGKKDVADAYCDCPYDRGGWCKHIVAVLLACLREPDRIEIRSSLNELLANLDREQLQDLLLDLAARDTYLVDQIESLVSLLRPSDHSQGSQADEHAARRSSVDPKPVRRQVRAILHSLDHMRPSQAYWHIGGVVDDVRGVLNSVWEFIEGGDGRNALVLLEAITDEYVAGWVYLDDSDGYVGGFFQELGETWTEACLAADLSPQEREEWAQKLAEWQGEINDYGVDDAFDAAQAAALQGWDYPPLQHVLEGEITQLGAWEDEAPWYADELTVARLRVLERKGRYQEYLYLAQAEGQMGSYVVMLAKVGREKEAIEEGMRYLHTADQFLALAQTLQEREKVEAALAVAEHGLAIDGQTRKLADWLCTQAIEVGESELALKAAKIVFEQDASLASYLRVQELAGEQWMKLREELLERLRGSSSAYFESPVDVFLHEGLLDDAIAAVEKGAGYELIEKVMDAVIEHRPDWVIQVAQKQADRIIEAGKAKYYHHAVNWLGRARAAYQAADREAEWQVYLTDLCERHSRKYKLMGMLKRF